MLTGTPLRAGDGFHVRRIRDPNTVYGEAQYAFWSATTEDRRELLISAAIRQRRSRHALELGFSLFISPHSHTRIYFAANRLFRSDDRGDTWRPVSPDLTRQIDRNKLR